MQMFMVSISKGGKLPVYHHVYCPVILGWLAGFAQRYKPGIAGIVLQSNGSGFERANI